MTASVEQTSICRHNTRSRESSVDHEEQVFRHPDPCDQLFIRPLLLSLVLLLIAFPAASHAIVTTAITSDGTLPTLSTISPLNPMGVCTGGCSISGGTIRGTNQFHSLGLFNVGTLDVATFNGPNGIVNILTRVTGGVRSDIDGTIRTTIPGANLFLMNPSGIMFGPNASLDIGATLSPPQPGSFFATTANYLRLADGMGFSAIPNFAQDALLTSAPVAAFGFLNSSPASITVD